MANTGWVNPKKITNRQRMDRRLERAGLLNYQTQGLSAQEIAHLYAKANIKIAGNSSWFKDNYGFDAPDFVTDRQKMAQYRGGQQNYTPNVFPSLQPRMNPASGMPQTFQEIGQALNQVRAPQLTNANSPYAPMVFGTPEQAKSGEIAWADVSASDRKNTLNDPNFYKSGAITKYPFHIQQEMLADPNFKWDELPKWQRSYYSVSSNPYAMGGVQGGLMGIPGGPLGVGIGIVAGTAIGWGAGVSGYDPSKEAWEQGDNKFTMDGDQVKDAVKGAFGWLNYAAEQAEKAIGTTMQAAQYAADPDRQVKELFEDFGSTWNSNANFFEVFTPAYIDAMNKGKGEIGWDDLLKVSPPAYVLGRIGDMVLNPDKYKGEEMYLGAASPIQLDESWVERIDTARAEIQAGRPYREVMMDMQTGIYAQIGDMAGQALADPLNLTGRVQAKAGEVTARVTGDKVAQSAFAGAGGYFDAQARLRNTINTPGAAQKIDPNFRVDEMGWLTKKMSGLTSDGKVGASWITDTGLLDYTTPKKNLRGFVEALVTSTPESRARIGQDMLVRNVGGIMASWFGGQDVDGFYKWWKSFSNGDMTQAAELSNAVAQAPEFYTVLPAAKGFDIEGSYTKWTATEQPRQVITRLAEMLGENPQTLIDDLVKRGTAEQDFVRVQDRLTKLNSPEAKALLAEMQAGRLTADMLADAVKLFSSGNVPFHPAQWMAQTLDDLKAHYDQWAINNFKLDEESRKTLFRVTGVMKSMQSILLLGANPGYMISNVLPTMATRAFDGVWGYMTPASIDRFMTRMGFDVEAGLIPSRMEEGVGPGGMVDQARGQGDALRDAVRGTGWLKKADDFFGRIGRVMPFNKLSRVLEGYEGKQAYVIGIAKFMGEGWRREKGFRAIPTELRAELTRVMGDRATDMLYSAIEAGMSKQEIRNIITSASANLKARSLIHEAAQGMNVPTSKAAAMLEQMGILDAIDAQTRNATTESKVRAAFERAKREAKYKVDEQAARDSVAMMEHIANRLQVEGPKALTDIVLDMEEKGIEQWLQHYERMGEAADAMDSIDNPNTRSNLWSYKYAESNAEFRRFNAMRGATYMGVMKAVGMSENPTARRLLATMADTDRTLDSTYRQMRDLRDGHFQKWNSDWDNPRRKVEYKAIDKQINDLWKAATKREIENSRQFGELLGQQYQELFGIEAGEAARQAWEQITAFRQEMTKRRDDFRKSIEGMPYAQRQIESREFWGKTYKYMIVEMERIKTEAIRNLDRIANKRKGGGDTTPTPAPTDPTPPTQPPAAPTATQTPTATQSARDFLDAATAEGAMPAFITNNLRRIANENGVTITDQMTAADVVSALQAKMSEPDATPIQPPPTAQGPEITAMTQTIPDEMAILRQAAAARLNETQARIAAVWEVAGDFGYSADQNPHALMGALRKYGDPEILGWDDPKLTPDFIRSTLEKRAEVRAEQQARMEANAAEIALSQVEQDTISKPRHEIPPTLSDALMLEARRIADVISGGEPGKRLFSKTEGFIGATKSTYPNWYNDLQASVGGKKKLLAALDKIVKDEGVDKGVVVGRVKEFLLSNLKYGDADTNNPPNLQVLKDLGADEAVMVKAADDFNIMMGTNFTLDQLLAGDYSSAFDTYFDGAMAAANAFDDAGWQARMVDAYEQGDYNAVLELAGDLPADLLNEPFTITETYGEYMNRVTEETQTRARQNAEDMAIAENQVRAENAVKEQQAAAEMGMTRQQFRESLTEIVGLAESEAEAVMSITDARANAYGDAAEWYRTRIAEVQRAETQAVPVPVSVEADTGTVGGLLPGMQQSTGMMFDVQPGSGKINKMDASAARSVYDIDPSRTATDSAGTELSRGDLVQDAEGNTYNVTGANMRGSIVTLDGKLLDGKDVTRVASQPDMFESALPETKTLEPEPEPARQESGLQDFGEKLGGARKDKAQAAKVALDAIAEVTGEDIMRKSFAEIFPKSIVDNIEDVNLAAFAYVIRNEVPTKPKSSWKLNRWAENIKTLQGLIKIASDQGVDTILAKAKDYDLEKFAYKVNLLREIPREQWGRLKNMGAVFTRGGYEFGVEVDGKWVGTKNAADLASAVLEKLGQEVKKQAKTDMKFEIRFNRKSGEAFINKVGDPLYRTLRTFENVTEARNFLNAKESRADLTQAWEAVKEKDNVKETDLRRDVNAPRSGKDWRQGKDASPEMFTESFGFRGVEFGNWVSQGKNLKERAGMLNASYDALMDLADILGVPPKALALEGTLGLGLGSRGQGGWAAAHFEPDTIVINMTKTKGAGSLAHEWFHALDNYFQRKRGSKVDFVTEQAENYYVNSRGDRITETRFKQLSEGQRGSIKADEWKLVEGIRPEVAAKFAELVKALDDSPMAKRSKVADETRSKKYWSTKLEMAARAFEVFVIDRMANQGYQNDYLANVVSSEMFTRDPGRYPYVKADEIAPIEQAFDALFETIETRQTDRGIELYQQAGEPKGGVRFMEDGRAIIRAFEKADVSTVVHEIGHIFRRDLKGNDLAIIEAWADVKNGNWTRDAEEKFARGFEKYLADGSAPTPKLRAVFEQFKQWMREIYRAVTGSPIDIDLSPAVKEVFDRLLTGEEGPRHVDVGDMLTQMGYDPAAYYMTPDGRVSRRPELNIRVDKGKTNRALDAVVSKDFMDKVQALRRTSQPAGEFVDTKVQAPPSNTPVWQMSYEQYKAMLLQDQRDHASRRMAALNADELNEMGVDFTQAETARMQKWMERETLAWERYGDVREKYMSAVNDALVDEQPVPNEIKQAFYEMGKSGELSEAERRRMGQAGRGVAELFQEDDNIALGDKAMIQKNILGKLEPQADISYLPYLDPSRRWEFTSLSQLGRQYFPTEDAAISFAIENGYEVKKSVTFNNTNRHYLEHAETKLAKDNQDFRITEKWKDAKSVYLRFGLPPESGKSYNFRDKFSEPGVSVYRGELNSEGEVRILQDNQHQIMGPYGYTEKGKKLYLVEGEEIGVGSDGEPVMKDVRVVGEIDTKSWKLKNGKNSGGGGRGGGQSNPNILFQDADPRMPLGGYEEAAGWKPESMGMDELWAQEISPLLDGMEEAAVRRLNEPTMDGAYRDMSAEGQEMLRQYMRGVETDLASTKMAATRWGQTKRDQSLLNYNRRTGFDQWLDIAFPYQFFYTRSMMTWAMRAMDNPAILANYARLRRQQDRYENNLPERLRGKMRIEAPWMPDWMGDALYIDPLSVIFTPHNFMRPFEQMAKDNNMQMIEAERILQEWSADERIPLEQIQEAAQNRSGKVWEQALAEAKMRRDAEISNPLDFVSATFGPAWYLSTPAKLMGLSKDGPETLTEVPLTRTARAFETVTKDTWMEPAGKLIGLLAKPEEALRKKYNLPEMGEYGDYYIDRQLSNMVAEGKITSEEAIITMIEREGELFEEARERVKLELAMRVPLMGATYAALNEGGMAGLKALPASLFGSGLLPEGELEYRGVKQEWNDAWKLKDAGDEGAINRFFDEHPEYESYLAKGKEPEERLRSFLIGQIWDGYMGLGETDRRTARAEMGEVFSAAFLNSETRSYDTLDVETLTQWAQMVNKNVPTTPETLPAIEAPRQINYFAPEVTQITDTYYDQRKRLHPTYFELERGYYALPKSERRGYLIANPQLKEYWNWKDGWYNRYPELVPVFNGQVFKRVDTSNWSPLLVQGVQMYAMMGQPLGTGAYKALEQQWIQAGRPRESVKDWLEIDLAPAMIYQGAP